jgi:hypothetical protein
MGANLGVTARHAGILLQLLVMPGLDPGTSFQELRG